MKKWIFLLLLICSISAGATTYQIANQAAFDAFNFGSLVAGDNVQFAKGQRFYGSITLTVSGTSGSPITLGAYGTGNAPIISGFVNVTSWTDQGSNIWESTSAVSALSTLNMVTVSDVNVAMGRYPNANATNSGYLNFESHSSNTSITDNQLTDAINWTGAEAVVRPVRWILDRRTITGHTGGTLTFSALTYVPLDGFGYFIQNDARTLDAQNEWYYNPSTKKIKMYSTSQPSNVKVAAIDDILNVQASYITIDGLQFEGSNDELVTGNSTTRSNIIFRNCTFAYSGSDAVSGLVTNNSTFEYNTVAFINNNGVGLDGTGNTIQYNNLTNIGLQHGMGTLIYMAITSGSSNTIQYNTVSNVGYNGISFYGNDVLVKNNLVNGFCSVLDDGGGIYTYTGNRTAMTNCRITGNIVLNGTGAVNGTSGNQSSTAIGIYLDSNTKNTEVDNNTVGNINTYGMLMNNPSYINIHHNTFYNCSPAVRSTFFTGANAVTDNTFSNNLLFATTTTQGMIHLVSTEENLSTWGTINNNTYARPLSATGTMFLTSQPSATYQNRDFASWKTYMSADGSSTLSSTTVSDASKFQLNYNATSSTASQSISNAMVDIYGTKYVTTVSVPAWSSKVLLVDSSPAPPTNTGKKTIKNGTTGKYYYNPATGRWYYVP